MNNFLGNSSENEIKFILSKKNFKDQSAGVWSKKILECMYWIEGKIKSLTTCKALFITTTT